MIGLSMCQVTEVSLVLGWHDVGKHEYRSSPQRMRRVCGPEDTICTVSASLTQMRLVTEVPQEQSSRFQLVEYVLRGTLVLGICFVLTSAADM